MRTATAVLAVIAALSNDAAAGTFVLRSSTTGVIAAPVVVAPPVDQQEPPVGLSLSMAGTASVTAGATLDLRPVLAGASGAVSFSYSGSLPLGATFDAATGRIAGRALVAGRYDVWVSATDSSGAAVTAEIVIVVT